LRIAVGIVVLGWLVLTSPWLVQGRIIPYDAQNYYFPVFRFLAETIALGQSPAWNPFLLSGHPAIADPQSWYFSITARLWTLFDQRPDLHSFATWQFLHLLAGAGGFLLLARRLGLSAAAAALGAVVFMGGGQALGRVQHSLMMIGYAWLPWALWALDAALRAPRPQRLWRSAIFGVIAALLAVNRDHVAYLSCLLLIALTVAHLARQARRRPALALRTLLNLWPAVVIGATLLAVPLALTLELVTVSNRPAFDFAGAAHASLQPFAFLGLLVPDLFGALTGPYWGPGTLAWMPLSATGFDWTDDSISHLYMGLLPLLLLFARPWRRRRLWPLLMIGVALLLYAVGGHTPVFGLLHQWVPGVDLFRRPADAAFPLNLMAALVAAAGLDEWRRRGQLSWPLMAPVFCIAIAAGLWLPLSMGHAAQAALATAVMAPWLVLATVVLFAVRRWPAAAFAPALFVTADLWSHGAGLSYNAQPIVVADAYTANGEQLGRDLQQLTANGGARVEIYGLGGAWQNAAMVYRLPQTLGYSPLRLAAYEAQTGAAQNCHLMDRKRPAGFSRYTSTVPQRLGIAAVVTGAPLPNPASLGLLPPVQKHGAWVHPVASPGTLASTTQGRVQITSVTTTEIVAEADLPVPARVRIGVPFYPGWTAEIGEQRAAIHVEAGLWPEIDAPAGHSIIRFRYRPFSLDARRRPG
jgi:hypothetical protein